MDNYTQYRVITRDASGIIEPVSGWRALGARGIEGAPGAVEACRVVSVEHGTVAGWGSATAIGRVETLVDGAPYEAPRLAFLK